MPTYPEMLQRGDVFAWETGFLDLLMGGGSTLLLALVLELVAILLLLFGGVAASRVCLLASGATAFLGAAVGILGSYLGYTRAANVVAAAKSLPHDSELDEAGTQMLFTVGGPLVVTTALFLLIGMTWVVRRKSFERSGV